MNKKQKKFMEAVFKIMNSSEEEKKAFMLGFVDGGGVLSNDDEQKGE